MKWAVIPFGNGKYEVSNSGLVRLSASRAIIKDYQTRADKKYRVVVLNHGGKRATVRVHRLVAAAFIPNPYNFPQVNHINGDAADNRASNLEWVSPLENTWHCYRIGTFRRKLTFEQAQEIRERAAAGILSKDELAHFYGVSKSNIQAIISGHTFKPCAYVQQLN